MNKRSVAILLFVIAIVLAVFSFSVTMYMDNTGIPKGQTTEDAYGGRIELAVLPPTNAPAAITAGTST